MSENNKDVHEDKTIANEIVAVLLKEKRTDRLIGLLKFAFFVASFAVILYLNFKNSDAHKGIDSDKPYVATVMVNGTISEGTAADDITVINYLEKAFKDEDAAGVAIVINSPGGGPVASSSIHDRILSLREEYPDKKVIAIGRAMLTSGAYMVATGAPNIYTADSTLVGSVGVIIRSYGFVGLIEKLGIERRVIHAGANKNRLDPFLPVSEDDTKKLADLLVETHAFFKDRVAESRGKRLKKSHDYLFNADIWNGKQAVELGLIDGVGDIHSILKEQFNSTQMLVYGRPRTAVEVLTGRSMSDLATSFGKGLGASLSGALNTNSLMVE